jgi:hypothetical protein
MAKSRTNQEGLRIRSFIASQGAFSDTALSLANKLDVSVKTARRALEELAAAGELTRRVYDPHTEPVYFRYRSRDPRDGAA